MNTTDTITGAEFRGKPIKTFNEAFEAKIRTVVGKNIESELREDGEVAFVVKELDNLIIDIMEFIQNGK